MTEVQKKEMSQSEIWKLAVEIWKLEKRLKKIDNLSDDDVKATSFLLNRMYKIIEWYDVQLLDYTGQKFLEWMAGIDILSAETDKDIDFPIIWEVMTPLVVIGWKIDQRSKVVIKTPENVVEEIQSKELDKQYEQYTRKKGSSLLIKIMGMLLILLSLIGITRFFCLKLLGNTNKEYEPEESVVEEINEENNIMDETQDVEYIDESKNIEDDELTQDENDVEGNIENELNNEIQEDENNEEQSVEEGNEESE